MSHQNNPKRVLHITNWYPNQWNPLEALFIKEHFDAVSPYVSQQLWHVQVRHEGAFFRLYYGKSGECESHLVLDTRIQVWRLQELLSLLLLLFLRFKLGRRSWDAVNVHIAYPLLRFPRLFKILFGKQLILSEHWSAFRESFNLPEGSKAKQRIEKIFQHGIPVVAVSHSLMNDIIHFAGTNAFPQYVIPNVINPRVFSPGKVTKNSHRPVFLMAAAWAPIKRPLLVMKAFSKVVKAYPHAMLRIIGYGQQWEDMEAFVRKNDLADNITLLGKLNKPAIAREMQHASVFVHASNYETFSVVCAEALCCGIPVIASNVGGIPEFVKENNGVLVKNTVEAWTKAMTGFVTRTKDWNHELISNEATKKFNSEVVGAKIAEVLDLCCEGQG